MPHHSADTEELSTREDIQRSLSTRHKRRQTTVQPSLLQSMGQMLQCNGIISEVIPLSTRLELCTESTNDEHFSTLCDLAKARRL